MFRRKYLLALLVIVVAVVGGLVYFLPGIIKPNQSSNLPYKVTIQTDFTPQGRFLPFFVAEDLGYYAQNGISVTVLQGSSGAATVASVVTAQADFGFTDISTIMLARMKGSNLTVIASLQDSTPLGFLALNSSGISQPKDMIGKTLAAPQGSSVLQMLPVFMNLNALPANSIQIQYVSGSLLPQTLLSHGAAMITSVKGSTYDVVRYQASQQGIGVTWIGLSEWGFRYFYGSALFTSGKMISNNPQIVKGFLSATIRGYRYAFQHPQESTDIFLKYNPSLNRVIVGMQWQSATETNSIQIPPIDNGRLAAMAQTIASAYAISNTPDPHSFYTNEFLGS